MSNVLRFVAEPADFSAAVWTVLTDMRHFSHSIQREDRIRALDWAEALSRLAGSSNRFYASFATPYNSTWIMLLRGFVQDHSTVIPVEGVDFDGGVEDALNAIAGALQYATPWQMELVDPALRRARLRSSLTLAEHASIAFCSVDRNAWYQEISDFTRRTALFSILPTDLTLTEEEHNEWVDVFVSTVQHLMVLRSLPWNNLRDAVMTSTDNDVKTFFNEVHTRLVKVGPCRTGKCARRVPTDSDWLSVLGPPL